MNGETQGEAPDEQDDPTAYKPMIDDPVHTMFGLTYANYLVLRRSVLQAMPTQWQRLFVELIQQINETLDLPDDMRDSFVVQLRDEQGRFTDDPYAPYRHHPGYPLRKYNQSEEQA
jgi:hypothetical protein